MPTESSNDTLLNETLSRLLNQYSNPQARQMAEQEGWSPECWNALSDSGLIWVGVPEHAGGSGGDFLDSCTVVRAVGRHATPLPIAECGLLGGWLIGAASLSLPDGAISVPVPRDGDNLVLEGDRISGHLSWVPWGSHVAALVAVAHSSKGERVVIIEPDEATISHGRNIAGEPRDALTLERVVLPAERIGSATDEISRELALRGALSRSLLIAGATETIGLMTLEYAEQRRQFGRSIGRFQSVAERLVCLISQAESASLATEVAARRFAEIGIAAAFEVGAAKVTASRAASQVAALAHQVHGAIGMTQEYSLHHFSRRLWSWRQEWGSESYWAGLLGSEVLDLDVRLLWARVSTGLMNQSEARN